MSSRKASLTPAARSTAKADTIADARRLAAEAVEQQRATSEILRVIASSPTDVQPVFEMIVSSCRRLLGARSVVLLRVVGRELHLAAFTRTSPAADDDLRRFYPLPLEGPAVAAIAVREHVPFVSPDAVADERLSPAARDIARSRGYRSMLIVPMTQNGVSIGVINVTRSTAGAFSDGDMTLLRTFADQAAIAIENARLFNELQHRTAQLQAASRHKDEFLANMSHELRTPLNSIIGFSEVLLERLFGDLNAKQEEYLNDVVTSGRHLLSLINDILDLSKIEAGKMELELTDFDVSGAIDDALTLMRERATRRFLTLESGVDAALAKIRADQRKFKQVLLNLLSNAVKFTPEGGRIAVRATLAGVMAEIAVTDSGIGIAPEDHVAVFEEFRQVGGADRRSEGTGLGLALCRKFVELHGGRIWVKSQPGAGSTFTFTLPVAGPA
jgi:signal transduction histidine kinase